jgi:hypothetical protein
MTTYNDYAVNGSLLFGDMGTALLIMHLQPSSARAELVHARASTNSTLPIRELMWGMPGSMLTCMPMHEITGEPRWRALFESQAARLLADLQETPDGPIWEQDLYHRHTKFLGPVHGYAGNMIPLLRGWDWLTVDQRARIADVVPNTLSRNAWQGDDGVSWRGTVGHDKPPWLCQYCHGAPGMVATFADARFTSPFGFWRRQYFAAM